jgi:hypothetical protein
MAALGCRLVFFHPMVWLAYRHLRWERELACDRKVVEQRAEARLPYAECLTRLARWFVEEKSRVFEGIGFSSSTSLLSTRVRALLAEPSSYSEFEKAVRAGLVATIATAALFLLPGLGLSLYSPVPLDGLFGRSRDVSNGFGAKKTVKSKAQHSSRGQALDGESVWKMIQSETPRPVNLFSESHLTALPVLRESPPVAMSPAETGTLHSEKTNDRVSVRASGTPWDEAPMPLARPPKWRRLVVGAITGGLAVATGRIDVDDVDGPRKRGR